MPRIGLMHLNINRLILSMASVGIAGAGPAGTMTARLLAEKGHEVTIYEEHREIGVPVQCSGLISLTGIAQMDVDVSPVRLNAIYGARIYAPNWQSMKVGNGKQKATVIDRAAFDQLLADEAEEKGVKIEKVKRVRAADLRHDAIVGADGAGSPVAHAAGFPRIREFAVCVQEDFENLSLSQEEQRLVEVYVSNKRYPGFFGWFIPTGKDTGHIGIGAWHRMGEKAVPIMEYYEKMLKEKRIAHLLDGGRKLGQLAGYIPCQMREVTVKGNVLLVGDAAGQVKATTGGGIIFSTMAARIAAKCIDENLRNGNDLAAYETAWRSTIGKDLEMHYQIRKLINRMGDSEMDRWFGIAKGLGIERFLSSYGHMDSPLTMMQHLQGPFAPLKRIVDSFMSMGVAYG